MGLEVDLFAATAEPNEKMFEPCVNVNIASRRLTDFEETCKRNKDSNPLNAQYYICAISPDVLHFGRKSQQYYENLHAMSFLWYNLT